MYVGKAKPSITKENEALKARVARLEELLQIRSEMLARITEITGSAEVIPAQSGSD